MSDLPPSSVPSSSLSRRCVEFPLRFSHSSLWSWQSSFYGSLGPFAFSSSLVPHFVTSNSFIAYHFAQCLLRWMTEDPHSGGVKGEGVKGKGSATPPVVVELGAGHGRLTFLILSHLMDLLPSSALPPSSPPPFLYVATDVSPTLLSFLRSHPSLLPFIERGLLDFALFDCEAPQPLRLICSGRWLWEGGGRAQGDGGGAIGGDVGEVRGDRRLFVLSNYTFNSLRTDAWQAREGGQRLFEGKVALWTKEGKGQGMGGDGASTQSPINRVDSDDPSWIGEVREEWEWEEVVDPFSSYYPHPLQAVFNRWVELMRGEVEGGRGRGRWEASSPPSSSSPSFAFLFPVSALGCVDFLLSLCDGRLTLLIADKGVWAVSDLASSHPLKPPHIAKHGSFSITTHLLPFHLLLQEHTQSHPHQHLQVSAQCTDYREGGLKLCLLTSASSSSSSSLGVVGGVMAAFHGLRCFTPDAFAVLQRSVREECGSGPSLPLLLSLLRLSHHDVDVFYKHRTTLLHHITATASHSALSSRVLHDLLIDCGILMRRYYPLSYTPQVEGIAGDSSSSFSPLFRSRDVAFELGRLCLSLGGWEEARRCFECSWRDTGQHSLTALNLSIVTSELGDTAQAVEWARQAEALGGEQIQGRLDNSDHSSTSAAKPAPVAPALPVSSRTI